MEFWQFLQSNWFELFLLTREHILIVLASTAAAVTIGLPLGILLTHIKRLEAPVLGFANVMQTVPSLALFGILIPIPFIGGIGARTAIIALALYAILPILRNTVTGITGVDPKIREAAEAMGMTAGQRLRMVELPLAAPVILTGIRVAVVISVGVATVAAAVGAGGLGTYIFRGLRQNDNRLLLAGAIASALLALVADLALGQIERSFDFSERSRRLRRRVIGIGIAGVLTAVALTAFIPSSGNTDTRRAELPNSGAAITVGSKDFTESVILAEILAQILENEGVTVRRQFELGGNLPHDSLLAGAIDVYPEYTGTAFTAILKNEPLTDPDKVYELIREQYRERFGLAVSPPLGFANDFAILIRGDVARAEGLRTISDAVPVSRDWQAGFGQDFMSRADGYPGFVKAYGFSFQKQPREMDLGLTYRALAVGELDIIAGNSTDGLIDALDLYQLEDDRRYFPPYQAVYIARSDAEPQLDAVFERLSNAITAEAMRRMNNAVDADRRPVKEVAMEWIRTAGL
jgi:osmoprotectant transport system permease protein